MYLTVTIYFQCTLETPPIQRNRYFIINSNLISTMQFNWLN